MIQQKPPPTLDVLARFEPDHISVELERVVLILHHDARQLDLQTPVPPPQELNGTRYRSLPKPERGASQILRFGTGQYLMSIKQRIQRGWQGSRHLYQYARLPPEYRRRNADSLRKKA